MKRPLFLLVALGAGLRLWAFALHPSQHPDEYFQYVEPAWHHLHGYGWPAWEWAVGLRSWVLPGYHGACMALLDWLGIRDGARQIAFLQLHWALLSLLVVPAAYRAAAQLSGHAGGLLAAGLCALLPELVYFAPHTLTELPSAILATWGYARWLESRAADAPGRGLRAALGAGALLSFATCLRLPNAPLALVPMLDLLLSRRWAALRALALGALGPLLFFGAIDWITWGRPFHSLIAYLDYNFLQGRAAEHGSSPWSDYLAIFWTRTTGAIVAALAVCLLCWRSSWPALLPALLLVALLSTQAHKEERFVLAAWPLFAIALGAARGAALRDRTGPLLRRLAWPAAAIAAALLLAGNAFGLRRMPVLDYSARAGLYAAEAFVGRAPDATGLLVEGRFHLSGGFATLGRNLPLATFEPALLHNPIFSHAAVREGSAEERWCAEFGLQQIWREDGFAVWRQR